MVPKGWNEYELHELCIKPISYGIVQTGENIINGIPCIRVVDLTTEKMCPDEMIKTSHQINKAYQKTILEKNINPSRIKKESRKKLLDSILLYYKCHFPDFYTPKSLPILVQIFE